MNKLYWLVLVLCVLLCACKEGGEEDNGNVAITGNSYNVGYTCASVRGFVYISRIPVKVTDYKYGVQWWPAEFGDDASEAKSLEAEGLSSNIFTCTLTGLKPVSSYYYRTYVKANGLSFYGDKTLLQTGEFPNIATMEGAMDSRTGSVTVIASVDTMMMSDYPGDRSSYQAGFLYAENFEALSPDKDGSIRSDVKKVTFFSGSSMPYESYVYRVTLTGLSADTQYYVCTYTACNDVYVCGTPQPFTTLSGRGEANGYSWIDLGLASGTLWATMNLGASAPEDYGDYFAWGEAKGFGSGKADYSWQSYQYSTEQDSVVTKYCMTSQYGKVDNKSVLDGSDDAAVVSLGKGWRMPTDEEMTELLSECSWVWTEQNGVAGCCVRGPNRNTIFLPAAGYRDGMNLLKLGSFGFYWTRHLDSANSAQALYFDFSSNYSGRDTDSRYFGQSIRPVYIGE